MAKKFALVDRKRMIVTCGYCSRKTFSRVMLESEGVDLPKNCPNCKRAYVYKR
jgi:uncharacterized Zn-finger protein